MRHYNVDNEIETFLVSCLRHCISGAFTKKREDLSSLNGLVNWFLSRHSQLQSAVVTWNHTGATLTLWCTEKSVFLFISVLFLQILTSSPKITNFECCECFLF